MFKMFLLLLCLALTSCKTCECLSVAERQDSIILRTEYKVDSVFRDRIREVYKIGDTTYITDSVFVEKLKFINKTDTIYKDRASEVVRVEKIVPTYYKGVSVAFWILAFSILAGVTIRVLVRVYLKK